MPFTVEARAPFLPPLVNSPEELPTEHGHWNLERAKQQLRLQQNQAALASFEEAVGRSPELETARVQLGVLAMALGDPERALKGVEPGLMRDPFHYELLALAGYASEHLGQLHDAVRYYERALESQKADEKLLRALASVYEKLGEMHKAQKVREKIRK
jgi:Flp pilus assembly protein TadD